MPTGGVNFFNKKKQKMAEAPGAAPTPEKAAAIAMTVASPAVLWSGKALACNQAKRSQWMVSEKPADEHQFYCLARSHFLLSLAPCSFSKCRHATPSLVTCRLDRSGLLIFIINYYLLIQCDNFVRLPFSLSLSLSLLRRTLTSCCTAMVASQ